MAGVGPIVSIVEVKQEFESHGLGAFSGGQSVFEIVGERGRRIEDAQSNPVVAVIVKYLQSGPGHAVFLEDGSLLLGLRQEGDIRPDGVLRGSSGGGLLCRTSKARGEDKDNNRYRSATLHESPQGNSFEPALDSEITPLLRPMRHWRSRLNVDQSALQRRDHGLSAITGIQTHQDDAHMALYRSRGDAKLAGNLPVGFAICQQSKHLTFAVAEV